MKPPRFWEAEPGRDGGVAAALDPIGRLIAGIGAMRRARATPFECGVPVLCVGNLTAGGQGKTPTALAIAERLIARGAPPWFLTRGYGGTERGPTRVDRARHDATAVGDEPLLLAQVAPTVVARDRALGAAVAVERGAERIIMDDGFQNPSLAKTLSLIVIDGGTGFGNGRLIPAGPLRESITDGLSRASAVVLIGEDRRDVARLIPLGLPLLRAEMSAVADLDALGLADQPVVAFAGIGRPGKFFESLAAAGATLIESVGFPDHHAYDETDLTRLAGLADARGAKLVTTTKDHARLRASWRDRVTPFPVRLVFSAPAALDGLLDRLEEAR